MKNQIKETFNQIHAPKDLIEETKLMIHYKTSKVIFPRVATVIACLIICLLIPSFCTKFINQPQQPSIPTDHNYHCIPDDDMSAYLPDNTYWCYYSHWIYLLNTIQENGDNTTSIELDNCLVYNTSYKYNADNTYKIELIINNGLLYYDEDDNLVIDGKLAVKIYSQSNKLLNTTTFPLKSSHMFAELIPIVTVEDINNDNNKEITFGRCRPDENLHGKWFTIDETYKLIPCP